MPKAVHVEPARADTWLKAMSATPITPRCHASKMSRFLTLGAVGVFRLQRLMRNEREEKYRTEI